MTRNGLTDLGGVVSGPENKFRGAVITGADVGNIGLIFDQNLGTPEVAKLENPRCRVEKQVLRLNVSVADALGVNVSQGAEKLVNVQLDLEDGHGRLHLVEESRSSVHRLRNEFLNQVEVDLIFLYSR